MKDNQQIKGVAEEVCQTSKARGKSERKTKRIGRRRKEMSDKRHNLKTIQ